LLGKKKKPTIKDIARETGVSTTTVLNVLGKKSSEVSEATAEVVLKKASELGYVRNLTAASLSGKGSSHAFALIITRAYKPLTVAQESDINPYYGELILRLEHEARKSGLMLSLYGGSEDDYVNFVLQWNLDAAVLLGIEKPDVPRVIAQRGIPVILIDSAFEDPQFISVRTDDHYAGKIAAEHLIKRGCRSIAFVGSTEQHPNSSPSLRYRGVKDICSYAGVKFSSINQIATFECGVEAAAEIAAGKTDGVVAAADNLAAGIIYGLNAKNIRIPEDVAVIGYDNLLLSRMTRPTLTTIDQGLGDKVKCIVELIRNGHPGRTYQIQPALIIRESA